ncbi:MAG: aminodeoxychorismate synthase component I [Micrococcales bacterium]
MPLFISTLKGWVHPADLFVGLHAGDANAFWLDRESHSTERFSVMGASSNVISAADFDWLAEQIRPQDQIEAPFEFRPGYVGLIDYEGDSRFMHIDRALVLDHDGQQIFFIGEFESNEAFEYWHHAALLRIGVSGGEQAMYKLKHSPLRATNSSVRHGADTYLELISKSQQHIAAGDVYQLCLTNEISLDVVGDSLATFLSLRDSNPAPYAAFLRISGQEIICCSPEQFLKVSAEGELSSKPIKGTRPRLLNSEADKAIAEELRNNEKERAENLMIVDLMRNDFGRVSKVDSVKVPKLFDVESYATVHQLVSTVTARLEAGMTAVDALRAAFPGGSMTGAPKLRAIELISELESGKRGAYSGALGFITHGGAADFGMVIRTIVVNGDRATIGVGGGITIDSVPSEELEETKVKARALLAALQAGDPWTNW